MSHRAGAIGAVLNPQHLRMNAEKPAAPLASLVRTLAALPAATNARESGCSDGSGGRI